MSVDYLTIPSQRRYVQYFTSMLTGNKPLPAAVRMVRIILNTIPDFSENGRNGGCCPYVQIFQNGRLIATATPIGDGKESVGGKLSLKRVRPEDGSVSFVLDCTVQVRT